VRSGAALKERVRDLEAEQHLTGCPVVGAADIQVLVENIDVTPHALEDARLNPEQIDYINAHGTSTPLGDAAETNAVKGVFGEAARKVSISSTKSQLGHSLGASGGIELVVTAKAVHEGVITPTINLETPDPACDLDYTPNQARQRDIRLAMSNSFGFGGHNASIVIGKLGNGRA